MTKYFLKELTVLTKNMIKTLPICDIHVHLPGIISPKIAWDLGLRNKLMTVTKNNNLYQCNNGPKSLSLTDPHEHYIDIFKQEFYFDKNGHPVNLHYNMDVESFKSFDRIMATVQGHRHPPGGIQNEDDIMLLLNSYLEDCIKQKIFYAELQQNIKIAHLLYPKLNPEASRRKLYLLFQEAISKFKQKGVHLRFLHCFNKTQIAGDNRSTYERAIEAANWLDEARKIAPNVFVGIESAGHEKDESGWPIHLKEGYTKVRKMGLGCEAHGGEGIGVEHMEDVIKTLPITRLAHGFQAIEDLGVIKIVKDLNITLVMMPIINLNLGLCIHVKEIDKKQIPWPKNKGGKKTNIRTFWKHPFFSLFREHKVRITLSSDNPNIGGVPIKNSIIILAGLDKNFPFPDSFIPLRAEELVILCKNGANAMFAETDLINQYNEHLDQWMSNYNLNTDFINNYYK